MRWTRYYLFTAREAPGDAEAAAHKLMVRAGMIHKVTAGAFALLPLGLRSLRKLEAMVRSELDAAGAAELVTPVAAGADESIPALVRREVTSYRRLPFHLYRIGVRLRDEARPRSGLLRAREHRTADSWSFHPGEESLGETCRTVERAFRRIFDACRVEAAVAEAEPGEAGDPPSHRFLVFSDAGDDTVIRDPATGRLATSEAAACGPLEPPPPLPTDALREVATPGAHTVSQVAELLGVDPRQIVKTLLYETDGGAVAVLVRGDREVDETKLRRALGAGRLELAGEATVRRLTGAPVGFAGPLGLPDEVRLVADRSLEGVRGFVCGANRPDAHLVGASFDRDLRLPAFQDVMLVRGGDPSPGGEGRLEAFPAFELARVERLGTRSSAALGCSFADEAGADRPMAVGRYGLDLGRTLAVAVEQNRDDAGIVWPRALAPFEVLLVEIGDQGEVRTEAERIYRELRERSVDVLWDDRDDRPGAKFHDADLLGIPIRVVVGSRGLAAGTVELSGRRDREKVAVPRGEAVAKALELLGSYE